MPDKPLEEKMPDRDTITETDILPASVTEARRLGERYFYTGKPCKRGHVDVRLAVNGMCRSCLNEDRPHYEDHRTNEQKNAAVKRTRQRKRASRQDRGC